MRVSVPEDVVVRDLADEAILLDLDTGDFFGLDAVGTRIWHLLSENQSTDAVIPLLLQEFEVEEDQLRRDLEALVAQLLAKRLLTAGNEPS